MTGWGDTEAGLPPIEQLTLLPDRDPGEVRQQMNELLGIGTPRRWYTDDHPDVSGLAQEMGLR